MKKTIFIKIAVAIFLALTVTTVSVFAWIVIKDDTEFGYWDSAKLNINSTLNGKNLEDNSENLVKLKPIQYLDLKNDVVENKYEVFDQTMRTIKVQLNNAADSVPVNISKIEAELIATTVVAQTPGIYYFIMYEGKNLAANHVWRKDYHSYLKGVILPRVPGGTPPENVWLQETLNLNQRNFNIMKNTPIEAGENMGFQIVIGGLYNTLLPADNYLTKKYAFNFTFTWTQTYIERSLGVGKR